MPFLTGDSLRDLVSLTVTLPRDFVGVVLGGVSEGATDANWEQFGTLTIDDCRNEMAKILNGFQVIEHTYIIDADDNFIIDAGGDYIVE